MDKKAVRNAVKKLKPYVNAVKRLEQEHARLKNLEVFTDAILESALGDRPIKNEGVIELAEKLGVIERGHTIIKTYKAANEESKIAV